MSSSAIPFSFCLQSFPASESFPVSWLFMSGGHSTGDSASASVLPTFQYSGLFLLALTDLISLLSKGLSRLFSNTTVQSINSSVPRLLYGPALTSTPDDWKNQSVDDRDLCWQSDVSLFNTLSKLVKSYFPFIYTPIGNACWF